MTSADTPLDDPPSAAADALRRACERLEAAPTDSTMADVSAAAVAFSIDLHDRGLLPEQMLVTLKAVLCDTGLLELHLPTALHADGSTLYQQVIARCIDAYFEQPAR
jgi:hypothetical protein